MGKGTGTAQKQLDLQNQLQQQQLTQQKAIQDQIMGSVGKYLTGSGEGFDPVQLATMQSQFLNQNTANFNQAGAAVRSALAARGAGGGDIPVGGDFVRGISSLEGAKANSQSQGILGTNLANLQQALTNRFNAASVASGQGAQLGQNVATFGQGANNSLDQYIKGANSPGFLQSLATSLAGGIGSGLGAVATGGIGASLGGLANAFKNINGPGNGSGYGPNPYGLPGLSGG